MVPVATGASLEVAAAAVAVAILAPVVAEAAGRADKSLSSRISKNMDCIISIDDRFKGDVLTLIRVGYGWALDMPDEEVMKNLASLLHQQIIDKVAAAQVKIDTEASVADVRETLRLRTSVEVK